MPKRKKKEARKEPLKKVPLTTGVVFIVIGIVCLVWVFVSPEQMQATYSALAVAFIGFGVNSLDKSGAFDR